MGSIDLNSITLKFKRIPLSSPAVSLLVRTHAKKTLTIFEALLSISHEPLQQLDLNLKLHSLRHKRCSNCAHWLIVIFPLYKAMHQTGFSLPKINIHIHITLPTPESPIKTTFVSIVLGSFLGLFIEKNNLLPTFDILRIGNITRASALYSS